MEAVYYFFFVFIIDMYMYVHVVAYAHASLVQLDYLLTSVFSACTE